MLMHRQACMCLQTGRQTDRQTDVHAVATDTTTYLLTDPYNQLLTDPYTHTCHACRFPSLDDAMVMRRVRFWARASASPRTPEAKVHVASGMFSSSLAHSSGKVGQDDRLYLNSEPYTSLLGFYNPANPQLSPRDSCAGSSNPAFPNCVMF